MPEHLYAHRLSPPYVTHCRSVASIYPLWLASLHPLWLAFRHPYGTSSYHIRPLTYKARVEGFHHNTNSHPDRRLNHQTPHNYFGQCRADGLSADYGLILK